MNAMPPRPASPEEAAMAADVIIPQAELQRLYSAARAERAREERRRRRVSLARNGTIFAQWVVIGGMAVSIASMLPLVRIEPVFVYLRDDGTSISSRSWQDMPADAREAGILNVLAEYVRLREGWSSGEAQRAWEAVSALSSKPVRDQFQAWYRRENPESPQRIYGERAIVRVAVTDVQKDTVTPGAYRVYFTRTERTGTADGRTIPMMASLRLRDIANPRQIPWWQRVQFNGPAVQVWEYPGAHPAAAGGGDR